MIIVFEGLETLQTFFRDLQIGCNECSSQDIVLKPIFCTIAYMSRFSP